MAWHGRQLKNPEETKRKMKDSHRMFTDESIVSILEMMKKYVEDNKTFYIGVLMAKYKYPHQYWSMWRDNYPVGSQLQDEIEGMLESNLVEMGATKQIDTTFAIFTLKSKYNWIDRQQIEHDVKGSLEINIKGLE